MWMPTIFTGVPETVVVVTVEVGTEDVAVKSGSNKVGVALATTVGAAAVSIAVATELGDGNAVPVGADVETAADHWHALKKNSAAKTHNPTSEKRYFIIFSCLSYHPAGQKAVHWDFCWKKDRQA